MPQSKELHFFDDDHRDWSEPDYADLERHFLGTPRSVCGEATPVYLYWPNSLERIKAYDPNAVLVAMLRHPTFRAISHWKMETARNAETLSFAQAIGEGRARVSQSPGGVHRVYSYVERGFYAPQVERLLSLFPRGQVHFATTDDLWLEPRSTLAAIEDFLCIPHRLNPKQEYIILANTKTHAVLDPACRRRLDALYADDIRKTARLTGLNLSTWLSRDYEEPVRG
jgi:hypothetical protein